MRLPAFGDALRPREARFTLTYELDLYNAQFDTSQPWTYYSTSSTSPGLCERGRENLRLSFGLHRRGYGTHDGVGHFHRTPSTRSISIVFSGTYACSSYVANGMLFGSNTAKFPQSLEDGTFNTIVMAEERNFTTRPTPARATTWRWVVSVEPARVRLSLSHRWPKRPVHAALSRSGERGGPGSRHPLRHFRDHCQSARLPGSTRQRLVRPHRARDLSHGRQGRGPGRRQRPPRDLCISQYTFWSAVTPDGGEVLGSDW